MAMRSQVYEWDAGRGTAGTNTNTGKRYSIFIGGIGNNITMPAQTTATQFCVIEDVGTTPSDFISRDAAGQTWRGQVCAANDGLAGPRSYVQVTINTTDYFLDPDNVGNDGIPGSGSPYPRSNYFQPCFNLYPDVYVLPGQTWDVGVTWYNADALTAGANSIALGELQAFVKYTLYDGPDALIANKLLEMGISVNPGNVDWYKRSLISGASAAPAASV